MLRYFASLEFPARPRIGFVPQKARSAEAAAAGDACERGILDPAFTVARANSPEGAKFNAVVEIIANLWLALFGKKAG